MQPAFGHAAALAIDELTARLNASQAEIEQLRQAAERVKKLEVIVNDLRGALEDALTENSQLSDANFQLQNRVDELGMYELEVKGARKAQAECDAAIEAAKASLISGNGRLLQLLEEEKTSREQVRVMTLNGKIYGMFWSICHPQAVKLHPHPHSKINTQRRRAERPSWSVARCSCRPPWAGCTESSRRRVQ